MIKFKIIIHCGQFNAALIEEHESRDAALNHYAEMIKEPCIFRFGEVLINTQHITFLQANDYVEEPAVSEVPSE